MAIPGIPQNFTVQTGNGENFISWNQVSGALTYDVQRSTDNITYVSVGTPAVPQFLDDTVTINTAYWYKVASVNGDGTSSYTTPQVVVPTTTGEMSLGELRQRCKERADRVNSDFVTMNEWNFFINQALYELYDLLIDTYEDYFFAIPVSFLTDGSNSQYAMPNGQNTFLDPSNNIITPAPFYKLMGVDLGIASSQSAFVTVKKFNFIDRNKYLYPNSGSTQYGPFNMRYRLVGNNLLFIPTPSANQPIRLWYAPRLPKLLQDSDVTTIGYCGWLQYVIARAAKYALDKEESDTSSLDAEILFLKSRIEGAAMNRDVGQPDTISDTRNNFWGGNNGNGFNGPMGGW